jgi:alpha-tubulin suppressor-like RCC1 family protein/ABC-type branched-subunit amino acid transport system substrate-binding protein
VGLKSDGTVVAVGSNSWGQCDVGGWTGIIQVAAGWAHTVGVKSDGTVVAVGLNNWGQCDVSGWTGIVQVAARYATVGVKSDGTVVAVGSNYPEQCNVGGWTDIVQVAVGDWHTVGLKSDGTVVAVGQNYWRQCNVGDWTGIVRVAAGQGHTVGVRLDGTVVALGWNYEGQCGVESWTNIVQVRAGGMHAVGLKSDGTVVAVGRESEGQCDVGGWSGIIQVAAGMYHTVGLKSDGTAVAVGNSPFGECSVGSWTGIVEVGAGGQHTVGIKSDGTVVAVGRNDYGECDVGGWTNIIQVVAGLYHTVGLKSDGTVVAVGRNWWGECNVGGWTNIVQVGTAEDYTVGLASDGTVVATGNCQYGRCIVGSWTGIVQVAAGCEHTVGLKSDGSVVAAGVNGYGECNVGSWTGVVQVTAGWHHYIPYTVGLRSDGTVVAAGPGIELAKWNLVETAKPILTICGIVTDTNDNPLENVDVYLYGAKDQWKVLDFISSWVQDATSTEVPPVPPYISHTKTNSAGSYNFTFVTPGYYLVLAVPQFDSGYLPRASDVRAVAENEKEILNIKLLEATRYLAVLDDEMAGIRDASRVALLLVTHMAADVYVDGYNDFSEHNIAENALWFGASVLDTVMKFFNPLTAWESIHPLIAQLALKLGVTLTNEVSEEGVKAHWQNMGPGSEDREELYGYAHQVNSLDWMKNFRYTESVATARDDGYRQTEIFGDSWTSLNRSYEKYNADVAYRKPDSAFSYSEVERVLQQQKAFLGGTDLVDGLTITPQGAVVPFETTVVHRSAYYDAKNARETAGDLGHVGTVLSIAGSTIVIGFGATGVGAAIGAVIGAIGSLGRLAFAYLETLALHRQEDMWGYTQVYWAKDSDEIQKIDKDIVDWLEGEVSNPTLQNIDGYIESTDIHALDIFGKQIVFANEPSLSPIRLFAVKDNDVTVVSSSSIDDVGMRVLCIDRYVGTSKTPTVSPGPDMAPYLIDAGATCTTTLQYVGDFRLLKALEPHVLHTLLWMGGKIEDEETDAYWIVPMVGIPGLSTIYSASNGTMTTQEMNVLAQQPIESGLYAFATAEAQSPITLGDWVSLLGNCTKIIDTTLSPVNESTQVEYNADESAANVTFFMATIPGSHIDLHVGDESARHVGYDPITDSNQIQVPGATYTGSESNPEIITIPLVGSRDFTVSINATQFTSSSPSSVEVYAIETPVRPAVLGISPVELYSFISPGQTKNITMQLAEVGQQADIEGVTISVANLTDEYGNTAPLVITPSQNDFEIDAGNQLDLVFTLDAPEGLTLPATPETRYSAKVMIDTSNAGSINATLDVLILDTDLTNAELAAAGANVTGIHLRGRDLSAVDETYKPAGITPQFAYSVDSTGAGSFTLKFTDIEEASAMKVYKIDPATNPPDQWVELDYATTADTVTFTMGVGDPTVVFAGIAQIVGETGAVNCDILPGVTVTLYRDDVEITSTVGNGTGNYGLAVSELGDYNVTASKDGFRNKTQAISVTAPITYTLNFTATYGLIPNAPNMSYVLACINLWKFGTPPRNLNMSTVLAVINAWKFPILQYNLTITSTVGGTVINPGEGTFTYDEGTVVDLAAEAEEGYHCVNWTGDVGTIANGNNATTTITMNGDYIITANFEGTPSITFAVAGPMTDLQGQMQWDGATMARDEINAAGGVDIGGTKYTVKLVKVETKEATEGEDGSTGTANLQAVIDDVDFVVGGFRTEVVSVYREVAMDAHKIFMNCGAATGSPQFSVVTNYDKYKYWFKATPCNESFLFKSCLKMAATIGNVLKSTLASVDAATNGTGVRTEFKIPADGKLRVHILMENAAWCAGMMLAAQQYLPQVGFTVTGTTLVSPTATNIDTEMLSINAQHPHIIFTAFSGSVGAVYSTTKADLGIPAVTIGINVPGQDIDHWADTAGACEGEIMLDTWAEDLQYATKTTTFFNTFVEKTGEYPYYTAGTYDAVYQLKAAIEATDSLDADDIIPYLETHSYTGAAGTTAYYPMPAIEITPGQLYALSPDQVADWYNLASYNKTYNQAEWQCGFLSGVQQPHIAHDTVYGPGYVTGIGSQWQDGHKVGIWPLNLGSAYNAALTDQYGNWNFAYPGTKKYILTIGGMLNIPWNPYA